MHHQPQKGFRGTFVGIPQDQKGCLIYVPIPQKIVSSHDFVFDDTFNSALSYIVRTYSEALIM